MNPELTWWAGEGGDSYMRRNEQTPGDYQRRRESWDRLIDECFYSESPPVTLLEVGAGPGMNLEIWHELKTGTRLYAAEPNQFARQNIEQHMPWVKVFDGHAANILAEDSTFDCVLTSGVLIHIHPDRLEDAMREIVRVSKRWVMAIEYFAPKPEAVIYYGAERIWRNDFGRLYTELGLKPRRWGFFWAPYSGFDNTVWWFLEKP